MDEATSELTRAWLVKARTDLASARKLASAPDDYPDVPSITVLFRYPGDVLEPELFELEQAMRDTEEIYAFIIEMLPQEVHP